MTPSKTSARVTFSREETTGLARDQGLLILTSIRRTNSLIDEFYDDNSGISMSDLRAPRPSLPRTQTKTLVSKRDDLVLHPTHPFLLGWDVFIFLILFIQAWTVPFEVGVSGGFVWQAYGLPGVMWHLALSIVFMLDTALCFFRATRDKNGLLIWRLSEVISHYLRGWFAVDLISCVPVYSIAYLVNPPQGSATFHTLELMQALRLLRITRITRNLRSSPVLVKMSLRFSQGSIQVVRITLICLYVAHCMACTLCFVHLLEDGNTWVNKYIATNQTLLDPLNNSLDLYVLALYWATTTMVSVGYGDVTPYTQAEYWTVCMLVLVSAGMWAWVVAGLVDLVGQLQADTNQLRARLAVINRVAQEARPVSEQRAWDELMDESRLYLQTAHWRAKNSQSLDALSTALEGLSQGLKQRVLLSQSQESLLRVPYLACARASTAAMLASRMVNRNIWVGETVLDHPNAPDSHRFLYFVRMGTLLSVLDVVSPQLKEPMVGQVVAERGGDARRIVDRLIDGSLAADVDAFELRMPGQKKMRLGIVSKDSVWGSDNFILETSHALFKPARLKALTFCECLALSRVDFLEAFARDEGLRAAVRWRLLRMHFSSDAFVRRSKS